MSTAAGRADERGFPACPALAPRRSHVLPVYQSVLVKHARAAVSQRHHVSPCLCTPRPGRRCVAVALDSRFFSRSPGRFSLFQSVESSVCLDRRPLEFGFVSVLNMKTLKENPASLPGRRRRVDGPRVRTQPVPRGLAARRGT